MTAPLLEAPTLVVEQIRKLFEMRNQYRIFDESGTPIGAVEQIKQSPLTILARFGTDLDVALPVWLEVQDANGVAVLSMRKPWFRRTFEVTRPDGSVVGSVSKRIRLGKAVFALTDASGSDIGEIRAENWRAKDFAVTDHLGGEVARTTKKWRGMATEMFTDADTYVVTIQPHVNEPLRSLAVSAALAIDVVMKQTD